MIAKTFLRSAVIVGAVACSSASCSSSSPPAGTPGPDGGSPAGGTSLDGTWDVTFTNAVDPGGVKIAKAKMVVSGLTAKLTVTSTLEGTTDSQGCKLTTSGIEYNFAIAADTKSMKADQTQVTQYEGTPCTGPTGVLNRQVDSPVLFTKTGDAASSFGNIGGDWKMTQDADQSCAIHINGTSFNGTCDNTSGRAIFENLSGTINGNTISGKLAGGGEFAAKKQ